MAERLSGWVCHIDELWRRGKGRRLPALSLRRPRQVSAIATTIRVGRKQPSAVARLRDVGADRITARLCRSVALGRSLRRRGAPEVRVDVPAGTRAALSKCRTHADAHRGYCGKQQGGQLLCLCIHNNHLLISLLVGFTRRRPQRLRSYEIVDEQMLSQ